MADAMTTDRLVGVILEQHRAWERMAWSKLTEFAEGEKRYRGDIHRDFSKKALGFADLTDMGFHRVVESVTSAVDAVTFGDDPAVTVVASTLDREREEQAAVSQGLLDRISQDMALESKVLRMERSWAMHGTVFGEVYWNYRHRWVGRKDENGKAMVEKVPYIDLPDLRPLPIWRVSFDPGAESVETAEWVMIEEDMTEDQLQKLINAARASGNAMWKPLKRMEAGEPGQMPETPGSMVADQVRIDRGEDTEAARTGRFRVKRRYGRHPIRKDLPVDYLIVIVNDADWVIQVPNWYDHGLKPLVGAKFITLDESMYGLGLTHLLGRTHDQIIARMNYMQDLLVLGLYGSWMANGSQKTNEVLTLAPGKVIYANQWGGGLTHLVPNLGPLMAGWQFVNSEQEHMRQTSGATTTQQAMTTGDTATEIKIVAGESGRRVLGQARQFSVGIMRPFWFMAHEMCRQLMEVPVRVAVTGRPDVMAEREGLVPDPRILIKIPTDLESRPALLRRMSSALQHMVQAVAVVPEMKAYIGPLVKRMVALMGVDVRGTAAEQEASEKDKAEQQQRMQMLAQVQALQAGGDPGVSAEEEAA